MNNNQNNQTRISQTAKPARSYSSTFHLIKRTIRTSNRAGLPLCEVSIMKQKKTSKKVDRPETIEDTHPIAHKGSEIATDEVLKDMAITDALDDFDEDYDD